MDSTGNWSFVWFMSSFWFTVHCDSWSLGSISLSRQKCGGPEGTILWHLCNNEHGKHLYNKLLEKVAVSHLVKKFIALFWLRVWICTQSWATLIQSTATHQKCHPCVNNNLFYLRLYMDIFILPHVYGLTTKF